MLGTDMHKDVIKKYLEEIEEAIWDMGMEFGDVSYEDKHSAVRKIEALRKYIKEV